MVSSLSEYFDKAETPKKKAVLGEVQEIAGGYRLCAQKGEIVFLVQDGHLFIREEAL